MLSDTDINYVLVAYLFHIYDNQSKYCCEYESSKY